MSAKLWFAGTALLVFIVGLTVLTGHAKPAAAQSASVHAMAELPRHRSPRTLEEAWLYGDYAQARRFALQRDDAASLLIRSKLATFEGKWTEAQEFARAALRAAGTSALTQDAEIALAEFERRSGELDLAEARLRQVLVEWPQAWGVRLALAELLIARGQSQQAALIMEALQNAFNNGLLKTSEELTVLGRAMILLGSYRDANYAFERALRLDAANVQAHIEQGKLFLSKYNSADAEKAFEEAQKINPNHPELLVALARLEIETSNQFDKMYAYLDRAERVAPAHSGMLLTRAEIALYDDDCARARDFLKQVLAGDAKNLEAMTLQAACAYFSDEIEEFERIRSEIFELRTDYASFFATLAHFTTILRGYPEALGWFRRALEIEPNHSTALTGLGLGLSRTGQEDEALEVLRRAFAADPYNVRVYNTLELYEKVLPEFVVERQQRYQFRAHKSQYEALHRLTEPVIQAALDEFDAKYDFRPDEFLAIEIFHEPTTFAVRGVGLPQTSPHGLCFGQVVLSRSPSDGNFNWRQVLWHELAHVYHLQLSNYRVPRWFTEGLAEYETNIHDESWRRYHDQEVAEALFRGELPGVEDFSRGFTHARSMQEVLIAYHLSSLAIHYLVETHGFDSVVALLRAFGEGKDVSGAFSQVLKQSMQQFDTGLRHWLERRLMGFQHQLRVKQVEQTGLEELEKQVKSAKNNALLWTHLAVARMQSYDKAGALKALETAVELAPSDATVRLIGAHVMLLADRVRDAYEYGQAVLDAKRDSYELRVLLGRTAFMLEDYISAQVHLEAATQLYADGYQAWEWLGRVAEARRDRELVVQATRRVYELDQHDPLIARRATLAALKEENWQKAKNAARRWVDIRPFEMQSHLALSQASLKLGELPAAEVSWQVLLALDSGSKDSTYLKIIEQLIEAGHTERAREYAERARADGVRMSAIEKVLPK